MEQIIAYIKSHFLEIIIVAITSVFSSVLVTYKELPSKVESNTQRIIHISDAVKEMPQLQQRQLLIESKVDNVNVNLTDIKQELKNQRETNERIYQLLIRIRNDR